jgi:hypothetical protein
VDIDRSTRLTLNWSILIFKSILLIIITHVQVIIPCMLELFPEVVIETIVLFLKWYQGATHSSMHTKMSLQELDLLMAR